MSAGMAPDRGPAGPRVVRLNRRVIYLVGTVLTGAMVTGLLAVRAQRTRPSEDDARRRVALQPVSRPWFEGVPDEDPVPSPAPLGQLPSPSTPAPSATRAVAIPSTEEPEAQRRQRALRAAMSAPIGVTAFEHLPGRPATRQPAVREVSASPVGIVTAADRGQPQRETNPGRASAYASTARGDAAVNALPPEYLRASVRGRCPRTK